MIDDYISAMDLGDEFYYDYDKLVYYLDSLPVGTEISDIVISEGCHNAGAEVRCIKKQGYKTVYYNPYGIPPSDTRYNDTWWELEGSEVDSYKLAKIIIKGTRYYCTRDTLE